MKKHYKKIIIIIIIILVLAFIVFVANKHLEIKYEKHQEIEDLIVGKIEQINKMGDITINLYSLMPFNWDRAYIFSTLIKGV